MPSASAAARAAEQKDLVNRLRRIEGQIGGVIAMIEEGRDCTDVIVQIAASKKAIERAGILLLTNALAQCMADQKRSSDARRVELQKAFLSLA
jgi:DNA-binding FrmR family transcriptional regulator